MKYVLSCLVGMNLMSPLVMTIDVLKQVFKAFSFVFGELDLVLVLDFLKLNHVMILNVLFEQRMLGVCVSRIFEDC